MNSKTGALFIVIVAAINQILCDRRIHITSQVIARFPSSAGVDNVSRTTFPANHVLTVPYSNRSVTNILTCLIFMAGVDYFTNPPSNARVRTTVTPGMGAAIFALAAVANKWNCGR